MTIKKAIIPAAGLGTRILPATKALPKEMLPIVDKPAIQYIVEEAVKAGIENILIVTGRNKKSIEDHFDKSVELEQALWEKGQAGFISRNSRYQPYGQHTFYSSTRAAWFRSCHSLCTAVCRR